MRKAASAIILLLLSAQGSEVRADDYIDNLFHRTSMINSQNPPVTLQDASLAEKVLKEAIETEKSKAGGANLQRALLALARLYKSQQRRGELAETLKSAAENYAHLDEPACAELASPMLELANKLVQDNDSGKTLLTPVLTFLDSHQGSPGDKRQLGELAIQLKSRDPETCEQVLRILIKQNSGAQSNAGKPEKVTGQTLNCPAADTVSLAAAQIKLSELLRDTDRSAAALELAELALSEEENLGPEFKAKQLPTLIMLTDLELRNKNQKEAEKYASRLEAALEPGSSYVPDRANLLSPVLDLCVSFAREGNLEAVKKLFKCALTLRVERGYAPYENKLREISRALTEAGNRESCESLYLDFYKASSAPHPFGDANSVTSALHAMTQYYGDAGDWTKLSGLIDQISARDIKEHRNTLRDFGSHFTTAANTTIQEKYYLAVLAQPHPFDSDRRQYAQYRSRLAELYIKEEKEQAAATQWRLVVDSMRESLPVEFKDLADKVEQMLATYIRQKRYRNAQQIVDNMANYGFDQNILTAAANGYLAIGQIQDEFGNTGEALAMTERAEAVCKKYGSCFSDNYANALSQSARYLRKLGRAHEATSKEKEATDLRQKLRLG